MVSLIYHRKLDDSWKQAAQELRAVLAKAPGATAKPHIIGRSRWARRWAGLHRPGPCPAAGVSSRPAVRPVAVLKWCCVAVQGPEGVPGCG
jgi:hypothetical protein